MVNMDSAFDPHALHIIRKDWKRSHLRSKVSKRSRQSPLARIALAKKHKWHFTVSEKWVRLSSKNNFFFIAHRLAFNSMVAWFPLHPHGSMDSTLANRSNLTWWASLTLTKQEESWEIIELPSTVYMLTLQSSLSLYGLFPIWLPLVQRILDSLVSQVALFGHVALSFQVNPLLHHFPAPPNTNTQEKMQSWNVNNQVTYNLHESKVIENTSTFLLAFL